MKQLTVPLDPRERVLILEYAYPFDGMKKQCIALQASDEVEPIVDDSYWWDQILGNLAITLNEDVRPGPLADELHALYERVEDLLDT